MGVNQYRDFVEQVRAVANIVDVAGKDVDLASTGSTLKGLSPFRPETNPSFTVWPETQSWCDFSGNSRAGGDVFAYVQKKHGIGFKEAVYLLAENAGIKPPEQDEASFRAEVDLIEERREIEKLLTKAAEFYHARLPSKIRKDLLQTHYGFSDKTIDDLLIGWADAHLLDHFKNEGISETLALKTGLFIPAKGRVKDFFRNRIVFPYWKRGQVVYFIARSTYVTWDEAWEKAKYKKQLTKAEKRPYVSATVQNDYFYNEDAGVGVEELLITEGVTDCISALQAGIPCISPVTTRFRKRDIPRLLTLTEHAKRIIICNDNETNDAGLNGALETAEALVSAGKDIRIATLPRPDNADKIDVNEFLKQQGADAFRGILGNAKPYVECLIDAVPDGTPTELQNRLDPILRRLNKLGEIEMARYLDLISTKFKLGRDALKKRIKRLAPKLQKPTEERPDRPQIKANDRHPIDLVREAQELVFQANKTRIDSAPSQYTLPLLFRRSDQVVRLKYNLLGAPELDPFTETDMFGLLIREADWVAVYNEGQDDEHITPTQPSRFVAPDLLAYPPEFPQLETVITTPVFDKNGGLMVAPGLHASEYTWMHPDPDLVLPEIPKSPPKTDINNAKALFYDDLLVDFPFVDEADRVHMLAMILLPFVRRMIQGCTPLHIVEAPSVGSGKSLLCQLASIVATGTPGDGCTLPTNEEEVRKTLTAELSKGNAIITIDNAKERKVLDSQALASVLTATSWRSRLLGQTEMLVLPNLAVWMLTGNNPRLSTELTRRSIRIRIDPKTDRAWQRENFKHKHLKGWAQKNRSELVHAALVLLQAWIAAGKPLAKQHLGSFEHWSEVIGGIMQVIDEPRFLANLDEMYAHADAEGALWREFLAFWWATFKKEGKRISELNDFCERNDLMLPVRGDGTEKSQQIRLGKALQSVRDRVYGSLRVVLKHDGKHKGKLYGLMSVNDNDSEVVEFPTRVRSEQQDSIDPFGDLGY